MVQVIELERGEAMAQLSNQGDVLRVEPGREPIAISSRHAAAERLRPMRPVGAQNVKHRRSDAVMIFLNPGRAVRSRIDSEGCCSHVLMQPLTALLRSPARKLAA